MKLNYSRQLSALKRWATTAFVSLFTIAFVWFGVFSTTAAFAKPITNLVVAADLGDQVQGKTSEDASRAKSFIRDTADRVERAANKNADRVDRATDNNSPLERRAKEDRATIHKRAEEDAARTQEAVDNTKNVIEKAVDNIKDAFGS